MDEGGSCVVAGKGTTEPRVFGSCRGMTRKHLRVNTNKTRINEREKVQLITRLEDFKAIDAFVSWIWPQRRQISCWKWKKANPGKMWEARRRICSRATPSIP